MLSDREREVAIVFDQVRHRVNIHPTLEDESALTAMKPRLLNILNTVWGAKLFARNLLSLQAFAEVQTLSDVTTIIDNFLAITDFCEHNPRMLNWMIDEAWFQERIKTGGLKYWNELVYRPIHYSTLQSDVSTQYIKHILTKTQALPVLSRPEIITEKKRLAKMLAEEAVVKLKDKKQQAVENETHQKIKAPLPRAAIELVANEARHQLILLREQQKKAQHTLLTLMNVICAALDNLEFWGKQVNQTFGSCVGKSLLGEKVKKIYVPPGIGELQDVMLMHLSANTESLDVRFLRGKICLREMVRIVNVKDIEHGFFSKRTPVTKEFYKIILTLNLLEQPHISDADKIKVMEFAIVKLRRFVSLRPTVCPLPSPLLEDGADSSALKRSLTK